MDEDEGFVAFVRSVSPRLLKEAWFICGDAFEAEELVQTALEKVYVRWRRLHEQDPFGYARRCMLNEYIDAHRRRRRDADRGQLLSDSRRGAAGRDEPAAVDEGDRLVRLLAGLPAREREIVVLRHYVDLSEVEVAEMLGVSTGTVKSAASRGVAKIRAQLEREEHHDAI